VDEVRPLDGVRCHFVENLDEVNELLAWLGNRRDFLGFDIETTGLNVGRDDIRLVQFGDPTDGWALRYDDWKGVVKEVFKRYDRPVVAHNAIFDTKFLKRDGIVVPQHLVHDSMVMSHLWDPRYSIGLEASGARYVDRRAFVGKKALAAAYKGGNWNFRTIPVDHPSYWVYGACDTVLTSLLATELWPEIQPFRKIYDVELACIHVLRDAGLRGMRIDLDYTMSKKAELESEMARLEQDIPFEPGKSQQIIDWLLGQGAKLTAKTEKGEWSTDDDALAEFQTRWPLTIASLRLWKKHDKLVNSYLNNFAEMNVESILYPSVKVCGARTGRMSVTEPALQTLPRGTAIRDAFISREGQTLILSDYDACELRVLASYAEEEAMIEAFERGEDMHRWTAAQAYWEGDVPSVTDPQRQVAKNAGYARIYGAGNAKIALTAGVDVAVIDEFMERYNQLFPGVGTFMKRVITQIRERTFHGDPRTGYVDTVLGRRLPVEHDKAYKGINYLIQASATADLTKLKLVEFANAGLDDFILLPVHDEIICECPDDQVEEVVQTVAEVMPEHKLFSCPIAIDTETTKRWGSKYAKHDDWTLPTLIKELRVA
jgi:DNA polymerase-1